MCFTIEVNNTNSELGNRLLLTCDIDADTYLISLIAARILVQNSLNSDYFSFKRIIIESNIESIIFIPLFDGKALNQSAIKIPLHNLDKDIEEENILSYINPFSKIDDSIIKHLSLTFWNERVSEIQDYENIMGEISNIKELSNQISTINIEIKDSLGESIFSKYKQDTKSFLNKRIKTSRH